MCLYVRPSGGTKLRCTPQHCGFYHFAQMITGVMPRSCKPFGVDPRLHSALLEERNGIREDPQR